MSNRTLSPALFKSTVDSAALRLAEEKPLGFTVDDVAAVMGCAEIPAQMRKRIRQRIKTLCKQGKLFSPSWGIYLASPKTSAAVQSANDPILWTTCAGRSSTLAASWKCRKFSRRWGFRLERKRGFGL